MKLKTGAAAAQEARVSGAVSGAVEQGSKCVDESYSLACISDNLLSSMMYFVPLGLLGAYFAWRYYTTGSV